MLAILCSACSKKEAAASGEPDVINSLSMNEEHYLSLIANRDSIDDKYAFAEEVIQMCKDNSFHTIKFSYDMGYPTGIYINVYLTKEDFEKGESFMKIEYSQGDGLLEYNIFDNPEEFELAVK